MLWLHWLVKLPRDWLQSFSRGLAEVLGCFEGWQTARLNALRSRMPWPDWRRKLLKGWPRVWRVWFVHAAETPALPGKGKMLWLEQLVGTAEMFGRHTETSVALDKAMVPHLCRESRMAWFHWFLHAAERLVLPGKNKMLWLETCGHCQNAWPPH